MRGDELLVGSEPQGWVKRDQVLLVKDAPAYYTRLIDDGQELAWATGCAVAWLEQGNLDRGIADFDQLVILVPSAVNYAIRGHLWQIKGESDKALADYNEAIRLDPKLRLAYVERGNLWTARQDFDRAIADYTQAIRLDPDVAEVHTSRGIAWAQQDEHEKAIADYDTAIRLDPQQALAFFHRARSYKRQHKFEQAIADYTAVVELVPGETGSLYERGKVWEGLKQYDKAIADFRECIRLEPEGPDAYNGVAWLRATCPDDAIRDAKEGLELALKCCELSEWKEPFGLDTLAAAYAESGDFDMAIKYQNQVIELNSADADFQQHAQKRLELYKDHKPYRIE